MAGPGSRLVRRCDPDSINTRPSMLRTAGILANASSVGANTVKGPDPFSTSTSPAADSAVASVLNEPADTAVSTMSLAPGSTLAARRGAILGAEGARRAGSRKAEAAGRASKRDAARMIVECLCVVGGVWDRSMRQYVVACGIDQQGRAWRPSCLLRAACVLAEFFSRSNKSPRISQYAREKVSGRALHLQLWRARGINVS